MTAVPREETVRPPMLPASVDVEPVANISLIDDDTIRLQTKSKVGRAKLQEIIDLANSPPGTYTLFTALADHDEIYFAAYDPLVLRQFVGAVTHVLGQISATQTTALLADAAGLVREMSRLSSEETEDDNSQRRSEGRTEIAGKRRKAWATAEESSV